MIEMGWLGSHGVVSNYADYLALPIGVLDDCRMIAGAEQQAQRLAASRVPLRRRTGGE